MNTPSPQDHTPDPQGHPVDAQLGPWLRLRNELAELHARLEYLRLIVALGVRKVG